MNIFRALLLVAWILVIWVSFHAIQTMGVNAAGAIFMGDFAYPWRAQFNTDFSFHLLLMALWIGYRERKLIWGIPLGVASIMLGGAFSLAYILVVTYLEKGDMRRVLLGHRAGERA